jgi:predicted transposase YdaD
MNEKDISSSKEEDLSTNSDADVASNDASVSSNNGTSERPKHDELFNKVMSEPVAAREFLEHYLPASFKNKIDLNSVTIEQESFVTDSLRKRFSDVVYSVSLNNNNIKDGTTDNANNDKAYVYVLIEHQSSNANLG